MGRPLTDDRGLGSEHLSTDASWADDARYLTFDASAWAERWSTVAAPLSEEELESLRGVATRVSLSEVQRIYLPLARLVEVHVRAAREREAGEAELLGIARAHRPFLIGLSGSVSVGKSTTSRILRELLSRSPLTPHAELITTDGFLLPNAELERRELLSRKGFPESYDTAALIEFVKAVRLGRRAESPIYSHVTYDVLEGRRKIVERPDVLILEGLNVLQTGRPGRRSRVLLSDYLDLTIFVDAEPDLILHWFIERFRLLRDTAFRNEQSYFRRYATLSDAEAEATARRIWRDINEPNLLENVLPTRERAHVVLEKGENHAVRRIRLRRF